MRNTQTKIERQPRTLLEAVRYFSDIPRCVRILADIRWPNGVTCPICASKEIYALKTRQLWKCGVCKKQFSVKKGTAFEQSPLGLDKWFVCLWLIANAKNGISSCEIARALGITQKSGWFMLHRCREILRNGTFEKMKGDVEVDESWYGGLEKNRHANKKKDAQGGSGKTAIFGAVERGGKVHAHVIDSTGAPTLQTQVLGTVKLGSKLFTDEAPAYAALGKVYDHKSVNHSKGEYVKNDAHVNSIEGYWSLVKRTIRGTYSSVEPFHLNRYLDEYAFRFNNRKSDDGNRFALALQNAPGRRLTHKQLVTFG